MARRGVPKGPFWKFLLVDIAVVFAALALAFLARFQEFRIENLNVYLPLLLPILLIRISVLFSFRLYDFSRPLTVFDILYFTFWAMLLAHGIEALLILYVDTFWETRPIFLWPQAWQSTEPSSETYQISRYVLALNFLFSWALASAWRILYLRRRRRWAYDRTRILIVGAGALGDSVRKDIERYSRLGHEVVGLIDDDLESTVVDAPIIGKLKELANLVESHDIDEIIVTSRRATREAMLDILTQCRATRCIVHLLPELYEVTVGQVSIGQVAGIPLITMNPDPLTDWGRLVKRLFDVLIALFVLIMASPLMIVIALAIRFTSKGPVFYRQERVGKEGRPFHIYKFRTMKPDAEQQTGPVHSWEKDPRVTPIGNILRRFHLDELPQLFNVLWGNMSLVGPRPERPHFVEEFCRDLPAYRLRLQVRPGMTGLAQIHGFYHSSVEHKLRYDLAYINNMSLLLDIKILFNTLRVTLSGHGSV